MFTIILACGGLTLVIGRDGTASLGSHGHEGPKKRSLSKHAIMSNPR